MTNVYMSQGTAVHECVSEEALVHLKSYKYSSVDKSLLSYYILNPYVREPPKRSNVRDIH